MKIEPRLQNPISIKLGEDSTILLSDANSSQTFPGTPGVKLGAGHYGFILIVDTEEGQKELVNQTQCCLRAISMEGGRLKVFEENKKMPWIFNKSGELVHSTFDEFVTDYEAKEAIVDDRTDLLEPIMKNPIVVKISKNPRESVVLKDDRTTVDFPLHPGAVVPANTHYGFVLIIDTEEGQKEVAYKTQNPLYGLGCENGWEEDLKVHEDGKYHPWVFTSSGELKETAAYNGFSRKDQQYIADHYGIYEERAEGRFVLESKQHKR